MTVETKPEPTHQINAEVRVEPKSSTGINPHYDHIPPTINLPALHKLMGVTYLK